MEMPRPTDAHRKLELLAGSWSGEERLHPSPWDPRGGTAIGRITNRVALDGFALLHDYEQDRDGTITFRGHGVLSWNAIEQCYVMHWFDSMGTPANEFRGTFDSKDVLTLTSKSSQGLSRAIFDLSKEGEYSFRMDVSPDGNQWQTFMDGSYIRE